MQRHEAASLLQGLCGVQPLIVVMFLAVRGAALTLPDMRSLTGRSADALQPALDSLCLKGWIVKQTGQHGKPSYMPGSASFFAALGENLFLPDQIPVLPESGGSTTTTTTLINKRAKTSEAVVEAAFQIPVLPESTLQNIEACQQVNIGEPKRSKISALPWVTPDFIREHVAALGAGDKLGLAILRIENNETPPKKIAAGETVRAKSFAQQQLDETRDDDDAPGVCTFLLLIGQNKHGGDIHRICRAETIPGKNRCSEHGGM